MLNAESALDKAIVKQATQVGVDYYHEQYDTDVVFTSHQIIPSYINHSIVLNGHVEGEVRNLIQVSINYVTYEITGYKPPEGFK
ncbi:hypothetical protein [Paenibacillus glacialis]|uniref:Uncharacterized protein n=1 Tax=Paenibacillus glacialis TaxID=494026 RepID=A0A168HQN1_9BACL|nr:hypothetical protein [Paenibacillus glacialis]OAB38428.1 hypothetical protein PGLA_20260 [Paenibacillus glacialis]